MSVVYEDTTTSDLTTQSISALRFIPYMYYSRTSLYMDGTLDFHHYHVITQVLYMSSSFWLMRVESRNFSQAEKERITRKAKQIHKMTIFTQNGPRLSF